MPPAFYLPGRVRQVEEPGEQTGRQWAVGGGHGGRGGDSDSGSGMEKMEEGRKNGDGHLVAVGWAGDRLDRHEPLFASE